MKEVILVMKNMDLTEGRGPMKPVAAFSDMALAALWVEAQDHPYSNNLYDTNLWWDYQVFKVFENRKEIESISEKKQQISDLQSKIAELNAQLRDMEREVGPT